jgi:multiple sugar transport system ATP-binding protein
MVFQNYALYPHMTVYENMAFALKLRKTKKEIINQKVREAAEILGITEFLGRKPKALSGGQRQRVAIGRAIVREPAVFLMDEPLSNLDAKLRNQMRAELIKIHKRVNTTFIYVTHDQTEAMTLGDRIVIMKDGFIQQIGAPTEVFNKPANMFVAGFIGTPRMNFFDAALDIESGKYFATLAGKKITLPEDRQAVLKERGSSPDGVTLGIRPEHIQLAPENAPDAICAPVEVHEMMGSETYLHVTVDQKDTVIRTQTSDQDDEYTLYVGTEKNIYFSLMNNKIHLFDADGKNMFV